MDSLPDSLFTSNSLNFQRAGLPRLDLSTSSEYTLSPVTPRTPFPNASILPANGFMLQRGNSTSNRMMQFNTPEPSYSDQMVPRTEHLQALRHIDLLRDRIQELESANKELTTTVRVMKNIYDTHGVSGNTPTGNPTHIRVGTRGGLLVPTEDYPSPTFDADEHGHFSFWKVEDWSPYATGGPKADQSSSEDNVPIYLEDEAGNVFTRNVYNELRNLIKRLFFTLLHHELHADTWGNSSAHATRYMYAAVYKVYPDLAKCQGHFRLHTLLTRMYPDFIRTKAAKAALAQPAAGALARQATVQGSSAVLKQEAVDINPHGNLKKRQHANDSALTSSSKRSKHMPPASRESSKDLSESGASRVAPAGEQVAFNSFAVSYVPAHHPQVSQVHAAASTPPSAPIHRPFRPAPTEATSQTVPLPPTSVIAPSTIITGMPVPTLSTGVSLLASTSVPAPITAPATTYALGVPTGTTMSASAAMSTPALTPATAESSLASTIMHAPVPTPVTASALSVPRTMAAPTSISAPAAASMDTPVPTPAMPALDVRMTIPVPATMSVPAPATMSVPAPATISVPAPATMSVPAPTTTAALMSSPSPTTPVPMPLRSAPVSLLSNEVAFTASTTHHKAFTVGNPLDAFRDATAPPLPSLITPAMNILADAASLAAQEELTADLEAPAEGSSGGAKKGNRMRVSKTSRTARNLYACIYMRDHPAASTEEFDRAFKHLESATREVYNGLHRFAVGRGKDEALEPIIDAYFALSEGEQATYRGSDDHGQQAKGKGKGRKGKGKAK